MLELDRLQIRLFDIADYVGTPPTIVHASKSPSWPITIFKLLQLRYILTHLCLVNLWNLYVVPWGKICHVGSPWKCVRSNYRTFQQGFAKIMSL